VTEIKQFNFKISATLLEQLRRTAATKDVTVTELIIQGIHQVLGIAPSPKAHDIDLGIYQKLDALEQRLLEFEGYQSTVDIKRAGQIEDILKRIAAIETFSANTVADIARSIYKELEKEKTTQVYTDINPSIDNELDQAGTEEPTPGATNIAPGVDKNINGLTQEGQLSLLPLDQVNKESATGVRIVNSAELVKTLQQVNPEVKWNTDNLVKFRRSEKHRNNWHTIEGYKFKYAGENGEGSKFNKHLWQLIPPIEEKLNS
jgi:hypothetical protein